MSLCERNIDCLECQARGMCNSYALFKYNQGRVDAIDECIAKIDILEQISFGIVEVDLVKDLLKQLKEENNADSK